MASIEEQDSEASFRAVVRGRVQGVGYRDFVLRRASFLSLTGYVRNLPDGRSVEVVAQGNRNRLEQLLDHLREGPGMARVNDVEVQWGQPSGRFANFTVRFD